MEHISEYKEKISTTLYSIESALGELTIGSLLGKSKEVWLAIVWYQVVITSRDWGECKIAKIRAKEVVG